MTREPKEDGCSFYVTGYITDGGSDHPFIATARLMCEALANRWADEIKQGFNSEREDRKPRTSFIPGSDEGDHAQLLIVCRTPDELRICLNAMDQENIWAPSVFACTDGWPTQATANVTLRLYDGGTYAQAAAPKGSPPLPGLCAARELIKAEIERLGGSNGY